jgi:hypothetical protein
MSYRTRHEISLGDLAIAIKRLPTQDRQVLAKIAACLGFGLEVPEPPKPQPKGVWDLRQSPQRDEPRQITESRPAAAAIPKKAQERVSLPTLPLPKEGYVTHIEPLPREAAPIPSAILDARPIRLEVAPSIRIHRIPIFAPRTDRAILSAAVAVQSQSGQVDLDGIIERLVQLKFIDRLPRRPLPTLKYGVQLLLDRSESMLPYFDDLRSLETKLKQIAGRSRCWSRTFQGSPLSLQRFGKDSQPFRLIDRVPILIATDFGIGAPLLSRDRARPGEWKRFARLARKRRCPVVALIPHKPRLWPDQAQADFLCIHWDRSTTAGDLRRVIGVGHALGG